MKPKGIYRTLLILFLLALNLGCDQATKSIVRVRISPYEHFSFLNEHFTLLRIENTGAFLSMGDNLPQPFRFILLTLLPVLALIGALIYILIKKHLGNLMVMGLVFCIGGGAGNLYDRVAHGSVTDFMHIRFGPFQTGVFNAADVSIMIGFGLILLDAWLKRDKGEKVEPEVAGEEETIS